MGAVANFAQHSAIQGQIQQRKAAVMGGGGSPLPPQPIAPRQVKVGTSQQAPMEQTLFHVLRSGQGKGGGTPTQGGVERRSIPDPGYPPSTLPGGQSIFT